MKFAERLRIIRQENGITQAQLARMTGLSPTAINKYEKGERTNISAPIISALASALGLSWQELVYQTEMEGQTAVALDRNLNHSYAGGRSFLNGTEVTELLNDDDLQAELLRAFNALGYHGKMEAVKRLQELSEVAKYQK